MHKYLILAGALLLSFCSPRSIPLPDPTQAEPPVQAPAIIQTPDVQQDAMLSLAIADLSTRLSLDPDLIYVLLTEPTMWPDSSLGCPQPGEVYTAQAVQGYQIWLEANDQVYVYHTGNNDEIVLCTERELPVIPITPGEIDDGEPWMPVD